MEKTHRLGRPGAGERVMPRAHARQLLLTLASICRRLRPLKASLAARAEYREVERTLRQLARRGKA